MHFSLLLSAAIVWVFAATGCNKKETTQADAKKAAHGHSHDDDGHEGHDHKDGDHKEEAGHVHGEWWCAEHGVPEEKCGLCSAAYANECKKNGDWCKDHERPKSHCFICQPALKEKFAAMYRAKYPGKEPPPVSEE
jgi:hypothetical protein